MRRAVGKVDMKMIDAIAREKVREIERITGALFGFEARAVFSLVLIDKRSGPCPARFRIFLPDF